MKKTYLKDFVKKKVAYIPVGTIEWHGNHLPIETDFLVSQKICESLSEEIPGYILPPFYLGTDNSTNIDGDIYIGMNGRLKKKLDGSIYFIEPKLLRELLMRIINNLKEQGFSKIIIVSGHGGTTQTETITGIEKDTAGVVFISPYEELFSDETTNHANVSETSIFWSLFPEEMKKSLALDIKDNDDYFLFTGHDPRKKASIELGNELIKSIIDKALIKIRETL